MKLFLFICLLLALLSTAAADSACNKNAWVKILPNSQSGNTVAGTFEITSGKEAGSISNHELEVAFGGCFFDDSYCWVDKDSGTFNCQPRTAWQSVAWVGTGNIEFNCIAKLYHCYDVKWDRT